MLVVASVVCARVLPAQDLKFIETDQLRVVYFDPSGASLAPYVTQSFVNSLHAQKKVFDFTPDGGVTVLLQDFSDRGNALAIMGAPRDRIFIDVAPPILSFETFSPGERVYTLSNHELVHTVVGDQASTADKTARRWLFGKVDAVREHPESILYNYLTNPRASSPRWYQEGSAVFMETWYGGGLGRAQGGYDEMVFRAMVRDDAQFFDPLGLVSKGTEIDFQAAANAYLYGTRFMSYLAMTRGPETLVDWLKRRDGTERYFARDFERVYGKPLGQAWQDWIRWEHQYQAANLQSVREHPITPSQEIGQRGLGAISRAYLNKDKSKLYAAVRYAGRVPHLVSIDVKTGEVTELTEVKNAVSYRVAALTYDPDDEKLFYTTDNLAYRNLLEYDLKTGDSRILFKGARIGDLAFNRVDKSIWGLRTNNGFVMVVRIPYPYKEWQTLYVYPFGEVPFDLDVSHDGKLVSLSLAGPDGERSGVQVMQLRIMSAARLIAGDPAPLQKFELGTALPEGFTFSDDDRYLYGSSYYTGVSNIYRYEIATSKLEALSNAEVGFFRPLELDGSKLLVFNFAAAGFVPAVIEAKPTEDLSAIRFLGEQIATTHPIVQSWGAGPPSQVDYANVVRREGKYQPAFELEREAIYPIVEGYKDSFALGAHARFSDPVGFDNLNLTVSYSPDSDLESKERLHALLTFKHFLWQAGLRWNAGDFYDLFGPTKRSREGYSAFVDYEKPIVYAPPETMSFIAKAAWFGDLDSLPGFQNVPSPTDKLGEVQAGFVYKYPRASVGAVDDEAGYTWSLLAHAYYAEGDVTPALVGKFDLGLPLGKNHSSIWLRTGAGVASGSRDDPLANVYFGGFRNNYVDNGEPKRYRDVISMPGFEIDALNGKSFVKGTLEWNLPPWRFEHLGSPGFYGSWIRPAIFGSALVTNPDSSAARVDAYDAGLQLDLQLHVLNRLPMMLSVGYARGFGGDGQGEDEFMLSLKVL